LILLVAGFFFPPPTCTDRIVLGGCLFVSTFDDVDFTGLGFEIVGFDFKFLVEEFVGLISVLFT